MIPVVAVFDLGKVLVDFDYSIAARRISERCGKEVDPSRFFVDRADLLFSYEVGRLNTDEFFGDIRTTSGFAGTSAEFAEFFADIFTPIPEMIALQAELRGRGMPSCIFSNTNPLAIRHIGERFPFFRNFDAYIYSFKHGSMKPDRALYKVVEREMKAQGAEILYIDDRPENIETGIALGWQSVLHESPGKTRRMIVELGLLDSAANTAGSGGSVAAL